MADYHELALKVLERYPLFSEFQKRFSGDKRRNDELRKGFLSAADQGGKSSFHNEMIEAIKKGWSENGLHYDDDKAKSIFDSIILDPRSVSFEDRIEQIEELGFSVDASAENRHLAELIASDWGFMTLLKTRCPEDSLRSLFAYALPACAMSKMLGSNPIERIGHFILTMIEICPAHSLNIFFKKGIPACVGVLKELAIDECEEFFRIMIRCCPDLSLDSLFGKSLHECAEFRAFERLTRNGILYFLIPLMEKCPREHFNEMFQQGITKCAHSGAFDYFIGYDKDSIRLRYEEMVSDYPAENITSLLVYGLPLEYANEWRRNIKSSRFYEFIMAIRKAPAGFFKVLRELDANKQSNDSLYAIEEIENAYNMISDRIMENFIVPGINKGYLNFPKDHKTVKAFIALNHERPEKITINEYRAFLAAVRPSAIPLRRKPLFGIFGGQPSRP